MAASKIRGQGERAFERRENLEATLVSIRCTLRTFDLPIGLDAVRALSRSICALYHNWASCQVSQLTDCFNYLRESNCGGCQEEIPWGRRCRTGVAHVLDRILWRSCELLLCSMHSRCYSTITAGPWCRVGCSNCGVEEGDQKCSWLWWGMGPIHSITGMHSHLIAICIYLIFTRNAHKTLVQKRISKLLRVPILFLCLWIVLILSVSEIFNRAFDTKMVQQDVDQIVAVILSRAGYERRRLETGNNRKMHFDLLCLSQWNMFRGRWTHNAYWRSRKWNTVCLYR